MNFYFLITTVVAFEYLSAIIHSQDVSPIAHRVLWHPHLYLAKDSSGEFYEIRHSSQYYDVSISFLQTSQSDAAPGIMNCECRFVKAEVEQQEETAFLQVMTPSKVKPKIEQKDKEISIGAYVPKLKEPDYRSIMQDSPIEKSREQLKHSYYEDKREGERRGNEEYKQNINGDKRFIEKDDYIEDFKQNGRKDKGYFEKDDYAERQESAEFNDYSDYKQNGYQQQYGQTFYYPQNYGPQNNYGYTQESPGYGPPNYVQPGYNQQGYNQPVYVIGYIAQQGPGYIQQPVYMNQFYQPDPNYVQQPYYKPPLFTNPEDQESDSSQYSSQGYAQERSIKNSASQAHPKPQGNEYIQNDYFQEEYVQQDYIPNPLSPAHSNPPEYDTKNEYVKEYAQEKSPKIYNNQVHPKEPVYEYVQQDYSDQEYTKQSQSSPGHSKKAGYEYAQQEYVKQDNTKKGHSNPNHSKQTGYEYSQQEYIEQEASSQVHNPNQSGQGHSQPAHISQQYIPQNSYYQTGSQIHPDYIPQGPSKEGFLPVSH